MITADMASRSTWSGAATVRDPRDLAPSGSLTDYCCKKATVGGARVEDGGELLGESSPLGPEPAVHPPAGACKVGGS